MPETPPYHQNKKSQETEKTNTSSEVTGTVKFSYMWPGVLFLIGLAMMFSYGFEPYKNMYKKKFWIPVKAEIESGKIKAQGANASRLVKDTGLIYKMKLVFRYSPRSIFGQIALSPDFPAWLRLPGTYFYWTESPDTFSSYTDAQVKLRKMKKKRDFVLYMNPSFPEKVEFLHDKNYIAVKLGLFMLFLSFLGAGLIWILNTRSDRKALRDYLQKLEYEQRRKERSRRRAGPASR